METIIPSMTTTTSENPVSTYFGRVGRLILHPGRFFREDFPSMSLSDTLTFGIVSAWVAAVVAFALDTLNSLLLAQLFDRWVQKMFAADGGFSLLGVSGSSFMWSAGLVLVAPFLFLVRIFFGTMTLFFFTRLLVDDNPSAPVTFRTVFGIRAAAFGGQWFSVVPVFGFLLAFIANIALLIAGLRERFRISSRRAAVIVLAPYAFLVLAAFLLFLLCVFALTQLPFEQMLDLDPAQFGL